MSHENGGDCILKKVFERGAKFYPNSLFLDELKKQILSSQRDYLLFTDYQEEEEDEMLVSDFICISKYDLYVFHLAVQKYLSNAKEGKEVETILSQFSYIPFDSSEFEEECTYYLLTIKPSLEDSNKRLQLENQAIVKRINELHKYISMEPTLNDEKNNKTTTTKAMPSVVTQQPSSLKKTKEEEIKEKQKNTEKEIASIERKIQSSNNNSASKIMPLPSKYRINVEVNKEKLFSSLPSAATPPARKVAVEIKSASTNKTVSPPGLKRFSPNKSNTSFDRGTYFGTYSSNQAATLRAIGRTNSTMWR